MWIRLYRHRDTSHLDYMSADGKTYTRPEAEADKAFNGPIDPPTSGKEGRYFWIRQKMPAEKTFPQGFEYVLMGVVAGAGDVKLETVEGETGLGTPPANSPMPWDWFGRPRPSVAAAPGGGRHGHLQARRQWKAGGLRDRRDDDRRSGPDRPGQEARWRPKGAASTAWRGRTPAGGTRFTTGGRTAGSSTA